MPRCRDYAAEMQNRKNMAMETQHTAGWLRARVNECQARVGGTLAKFDQTSAVRCLLNTLRAVEELINLTLIDWEDDAFKRRLFAFPVIQSGQHLLELHRLKMRLAERYDCAMVDRLIFLILQGSDIGAEFARRGAQDAVNGFLSLAALVGYFQSRRRHLVGLLHFIPFACKGPRVMKQEDSLIVFLQIIEFCAAPMMGAQYALMVKLAQRRLNLPEDPDVEIAMLNRLYLEPERAAIDDVPTTPEGRLMIESREPLRNDRLFSAAELRNDILIAEAVYAEFDLTGTEFAIAASLVRRLSREFVDDDYWVRISPDVLKTLAAEEDAPPTLVAALTCGATTYMDCLSSYAPFVVISDRLESTVTLLSRFIYSWRAYILDRRKRFQIRAGFIFEDLVKIALEKQGFAVQDIVRINRQEFDVVTLRKGVVWNVQCKNNFIGLSNVDSDAEAFARYNRGLVLSYERALVKERNREHLLKMKLATDSLQHMIVSRFPVVTNNPHIVVFNRIADFAARAQAVLAAEGSAIND